MKQVYETTRYAGIGEPSNDPIYQLGLKLAVKNNYNMSWD